MVDGDRMNTITVTAAELHGPTDHGSWESKGSLILIDCRRYRVTMTQRRHDKFVELHVSWEPDSPHERSSESRTIEARLTDRFELVVEDGRGVA